MGPKGRKHCCKPDKDEENMTVGIMRAFIIFFESIGCFVVYINVGGGAVEPIMKRVQESLTPEQKKAVCVVTKSTHMYRVSESMRNILLLFMMLLTFIFVAACVLWWK